MHEEAESPEVEKAESIAPLEREESNSLSTINGSRAPSLRRRPTGVPAEMWNEELHRLDEEGLKRTQSRTLDRASTVLSKVRSRKPIGPFQHPLLHEQTGPDVIVEFEGLDDPYRPINWPFKKKVWTTALYGFTTMGATFASSVYSPAVTPIAKEFHVGTEVSILGIALLLFGFGLGPLIWAPLSEVYGRKPAVLIPYAIAMIFSFSTGAAKDIQTVCITRFFAGLFGSAPVTNTGGVLGDIWAPEQRGTAIVGYAMAVVGGPTIGPIVGGAVVDSYLGWRWTQYVRTALTLSLICHY